MSEATPSNHDWHDQFVSLMLQPDIEKMAPEIRALKYAHMPKRLFKFYRFDKDNYGLTNFEKNQAWLSLPIELNDPFDCWCTVQLREYLSEIAKPFFFAREQSLIEAGVPTDEILRLHNSSDLLNDLNKVIHRYAPHDREAVDGVTRINEKADGNAIAETLRRSVVVTSFTERVDSPIMWSHYAWKHTGFALEYDFKSEGENFIEGNLFPVVYRDEVFDLTDFARAVATGATQVGGAPKLATMQKARDWAYEKEWRFIAPPSLFPRGPLQLPLPRAAYLGLQIEPNNETDFRAMADKKGVPTFKAKQAKNLFKMEFPGR